jgi:hypothetical protein
MKPRLPDEPITIAVGNLTATLDHDFDRFSSGHMRMTFADCEAEVFENVDGTSTQVGTVRGCIGSGVAITIGRREWFLSAESIWHAVKAADDAYLNAQAEPPTAGGVAVD